jgi:hypothetical protein|tara:strand:- start:583 stop:1098 length:516 start_codon:yes stop_codon:yes gene_type:complete
MNAIVATAVSVGVLGGIATWLFLSIGSILIWAAFAAWACYFHSGGDQAALKSTIICNILGVVAAWVAALVILAIPLAEVLTLPVWAGIVVIITVAIYILLAQVEVFASVPGTTYGYACTFAYLLQTPDKLNLDTLTSATMSNALIVVIISMVIGAIFAFVSGKWAAAMTKS